MDEMTKWGVAAAVVMVMQVATFFLGRQLALRTHGGGTSDTVHQRTDFVGHTTIMIVLIIAGLAGVSYWRSPMQWEFVQQVVDILDRSLFLCLGYLIRDKQDTTPAAPVTVAVPPTPTKPGQAAEPTTVQVG